MNQSVRHADVFISFATRDRKVATTLCAALESRGFKCWISSRDIPPGGNFQSAIVQAIRRVQLMLLVFTANSNNSDEMNKELALASQHKLTVVPLRVEDVTPNDAFAYEFATRQWIDFFADWELAMDQLSAQIATILRAPEAEGQDALTAAHPEPHPSHGVHPAPIAPAVDAHAPAPVTNAAPPVEAPEARVAPHVEAPTPPAAPVVATPAAAPIATSASAPATAKAVEPPPTTLELKVPPPTPAPKPAPTAAVAPAPAAAANPAATPAAKAPPPARPPAAPAAATTVPAPEAHKGPGIGLYIGIGAAVLALAGVGAAVVVLGKKPPPAHVASSAPSSAAPLAEVAPKGELAPPPAVAISIAPPVQSSAAASAASSSMAAPANSAAAPAPSGAPAVAAPVHVHHHTATAPTSEQHTGAPTHASRSDLPY